MCIFLFWKAIWTNCKNCGWCDDISPQLCGFLKKKPKDCSIYLIQFHVTRQTSGCYLEMVYCNILQLRHEELILVGSIFRPIFLSKNKYDDCLLSGFPKRRHGSRTLWLESWTLCPVPWYPDFKNKFNY